MFQSALGTPCSKNKYTAWSLNGLCHGMVSAIFCLFVLSYIRSEYLNAARCSTNFLKSWEINICFGFFLNRNLDQNYRSTVDTKAHRFVPCNLLLPKSYNFRKTFLNYLFTARIRNLIGIPRRNLRIRIHFLSEVRIPESGSGNGILKRHF